MTREDKNKHKILTQLIKSTGFFKRRSKSRTAMSRKYYVGERVTPSDTPRTKSNQEYLFVSSMRWEPYKSNSGYGGFILLNPRTNKLISATNIHSLDHPFKNTNRM